MPQLLPLRLREAASRRAAAASDAVASDAATPEEVFTESIGVETSALPQVDPMLERTGPLAIIAPRRIGQSDLAVFPLSLGASVFGWTADGDTSLRILDRFAHLGGNFVDTAG